MSTQGRPIQSELPSLVRQGTWPPKNSADKSGWRCADLAVGKRRKGTSHIRVLRNLITTIGLDLLIFTDTVAAPVGEIPARAAFLHAIGGMPDEFRGEAS